MKLSFPEYHLFQILKRFDHQHLPLDLFINHYFRANKALGSKDRQQILENIYGMTRWLSLLDHLVEGQPSWEKRYQVYQTFQPDQFLYVNSIPLNVRVSFPEELFQLLVKQYGEEKAVKLCQICNTQAPITIRTNPLKISRDVLLDRFAQRFDVAPCEHSDLGILFKKREPLASLPEFKEGFFEIQDEASQLAASLVDVQPGQHVLDYCAGAGGKTLAFAHKLQNQGQIYLHDIRSFILTKARERLKRAGIQNAQYLPPDHAHLSKLKKKMDWVLVDAPCSGTGTLRRNPDQKWKFSQETLTRLLGQQRMIFEKGLSYLKPGGKIVYATCSLLRDENEKQVEHFLATYPLKLVKDPFVSLPTYGGMDGFFAVVLERTKEPNE